MSHYDVIVVGAGPAGNVAAFELARGGAKVALIEKHPLPRHKTCGGGMPMVVEQLLELDTLRDLAPDAFVEADTRFMRHTWNFGEPVFASLNPDDADPRRLSLWMVRRSVFDNALARRAANAGAELRDALAVKSLVFEQNAPVRVVADGNQGSWEATADTVIGADGANGVVARLVGLRRQRALAIAIEAEVPHTWGDGHSDLRVDVCHLEYGAVPRGYAWVFPKGDHLNVGAGIFRPRDVSGRGDSTVRLELRKAILDYLQMLGVPKREENLVFHAHPLPVWNGMDRVQTPDNSVLLVGDSAGLINPIFGDGILHALKSGKIAAHHILSGDAAGYSRAIAMEFKANFDAALKLSKFFYQWSRFCYQHGVRRPGSTRVATRLLCGDALFQDVAGRAMRRIRQAILSGSEPDSVRAEGQPVGSVE
jgi:geranylgeranyl reductase family protein